MKYSISVEYSQSWHRAGEFAYALRARVVASENLPKEVFVMHRGMRRMGDGRVVDHFDHVATPLDVEELPTTPSGGVSLDSEVQPYYLVDEIVIWFRCLDDLERARKSIDEDVESLVATYRKLGDFSGFVNTETVVHEREAEDDEPGSND